MANLPPPVRRCSRVQSRRDNFRSRGTIRYAQHAPTALVPTSHTARFTNVVLVPCKLSRYSPSQGGDPFVSLYFSSDLLLLALAEHDGAATFETDDAQLSSHLIRSHRINQILVVGFLLARVLHVIAFSRELHLSGSIEEISRFILSRNEVIVD